MSKEAPSTQPKLKRIIPMKPEFFDANAEGKPYSEEDRILKRVMVKASKLVKDDAKMGQPAQFGVLGEPHWECVFGEVIPADKQPSAAVLNHILGLSHEVEMA